MSAPSSSSEPSLPLALPEGTPSDAIVLERRQQAEALKAERADFWALVGCNAIVFWSSVCIMVLELTASRLIASHLGNSLYSWTSVIGVVLAGISLGNFLGGWLADRYPPQRTLSWLFFIAGLLTLSVLLVNQWAGKTKPPELVSWPLWVIVVVAWIFLPASVALGTISPVTASMALQRSRKLGRTVGNIYAWGALGSIAGTFLAGFVLIDVLGTRAIVVVTAGALFAMSAAVATGQRALRSFITFGIVPWLVGVGMCVAGTAETTAAVAAKFRSVIVRKRDPDYRALVQESRNWGARLGLHAHELGLLFNLRRDQPGDYHDESNYSEISIRRQGSLLGDPRYQVLILDRLDHSYYDPDDPTQLYYEYEKVYAAVTERAAAGWKRQTAIGLRQVPVKERFGKSVPPGLTFQSTTKRLTVQGAMSPEQFRQLLALGSDGKFRDALFQAMLDSRLKPNNSSQTPLEKLPEGVVFPIEMAERIQYSPYLQQITCEKPLRLADALHLMRQGSERPYVEDIIALFGRSRRVATMFIGGGGCIFPRWVEERFPDEPVIDVAEIDPAVLVAIETALGMPPPDKTRVRAHITDARKFVNDQVRRNAALKLATGTDAAASAPIKYDFIYGDAFNHYSVPWHLTTREFDRQVRELLRPGEGVYLVNVIDIFPRAEYPARDRLVGSGTVICEGPLPDGLLSRKPQRHEVLRAEPPFADLQVHWLGEVEFELSSDRVMSSTTRDALIRRTQFQKLERVGGGAVSEEVVVWKDDPTFVGFRDAVQQLYSQTHRRQTYRGTLPAALTPGVLSENWTPAPEPWQSLEVRKWIPSGYMLGYRGRMSEATRQKLLQLLPGDEDYVTAINALDRAARAQTGGQFLGRYVNTVRQVFPFVYVFTSFESGPSDDRDTFVVACSLRKLDFTSLETAGGYWPGSPFAWTEHDARGQPVNFGQMSALLDRADGQILTDDYAPVDNLLAPLFEADD